MRTSDPTPTERQKKRLITGRERERGGERERERPSWVKRVKRESERKMLKQQRDRGEERERERRERGERERETAHVALPLVEERMSGRLRER